MPTRLVHPEHGWPEVGVAGHFKEKCELCVLELKFEQKSLPMCVQVFFCMTSE